MKRIHACLVLVLAIGVSSLLTNCGSTGTGRTYTPPIVTPPAPTVNPMVVAKNIYVVNFAKSSIDVFPANLNGSVPPSASYAGSSSAVTGDAAGNLYAANYSTGSAVIQVYASGSLTASRSITVPNTILAANSQILTMATDKNANLYVAFPNVVYVYAPTASGTAAPIRTLTGAATTLSLSITQMAVDSEGDLFVAEGGVYPATQVVEFAPGATGNVAPKVVTAPAYFPTRVALDAAENLYISQGRGSCGGCGSYSPAIVEFAKGSTAGATPLRTLAGDNLGVSTYANNLAVDAAGNIFLDVVLNGNSDFLVFAPGVSGNVAPASILIPSQGTTTDAQFYLR